MIEMYERLMYVRTLVMPTGNTIEKQSDPQIQK